MLEQAYDLTLDRALQERALQPDARALAEERPDTVPESVWLGLSQEQRVMSVLRRRQRQEQRRLRDTLTDADRLRVVYEQAGIVQADIDDVQLLWSQSRANAKNPTADILVRRVIESRQEDEPLTFALSQCIAKDPSVREGKLEYFLRGQKGSRVPRFTAGLETKGWPQLKVILDGLSRPAQATLYLGDMDMLTMDGCTAWCEPDDLERLPAEIVALRDATQQRADETFGLGRVAVRAWSQEYGLGDYEPELARAEAAEDWRTPDFLRTSRYPYLNSWGYPAIARRMGISQDALRRFIDADVVRTAAQYRLEATILDRRRAVQLWAETVADPLWPVQISDYDRAGVPPSLVLT